MDDNLLISNNASHLTTKQQIVNSFIHLLNQTPNRPLKVVEICQHAAINRGTFYHYFENEQGLVEACEDYLVNKLYIFAHGIFEQQTLTSFTRQLSTIHLNFFNQFSSDLPLIDVLLHKSSRSHLTEKLVEVIEDCVADGLATIAPKSDTQARTLISAESSAEVIGLLSYWSIHPDINANDLANLLTLSKKGQLTLLKNKTQHRQ
ncbi:TetR/AcrR family transcriptional regulator [Lactobacillus sp. LC28-10]|uniref:TetR/AcrR family transcriptional regulator n=1 Tax=Secundilactobacillus angelensis TaxID=2722706 RepID=A0ABX1L565_9LACO|nr:TetR/AcrR family transcriptional regulator [Secundilactobacillus angelensis]MCH5463383.1 TetR/AcrR family transcriptional regulator [Secundilactobacillus angelensis]NLR19416.1 TetR/AcrR family transcriptional regulator [Secundilactobacillus angelensis]